jgi:tetratricopeptide (TPR) repeat protein
VNRPDTALRPLHAVWEARLALRSSAAGETADRAAVIEVAHAIELSLRRLLRDDPGQPLDTRLNALSTDELTAEHVIAALRQNDRVSIELAAAFHDVQRLRQRLEYEGAADRREIDLVLGLAERVEREVMSGHRAAAPIPADATVELDGAATDPAPEPTTHRRVELAPLWIALAAAALLVLVGGLWWASGRTSPRMDEAVALFRTGDHARAAAEFERHAAARPDDPTPRLYLARIDRRAGRLDAAREHLRAGLEAAPEDAALHRELGFVLLDAGQAEAAARRFRGAVERDPESVEGWLGLVRALRESGQHEAAERVLARAPVAARDAARRSATPGF